MQSIAIDSGAAITDAAVKGTLFTVSGSTGTILVWFAAWAPALTATCAIGSFLMGFWYYRKMVKLRKIEIGEEVLQLVKENTKEATPEDMHILRKYFDI